MPQTMREWLEERQANNQSLTLSLRRPESITLTGASALAAAMISPYASELDMPVEEVELTELYRMSGKIGHIGRTAHLAFVYVTDLQDAPGEE